MMATLSTTARARSVTTVETVDHSPGFAALESEWNELLEASESDGLFLTWEWLYTWWKHLSGSRSLRILAVRSGSELIALAPLVRRPASVFPWRPAPALEFLGSGFAGSDYLDVIVRRGWQHEAWQALSARLNTQKLNLDWTQLKRGASLTEGLASLLGQNRWRVSETGTNVCPFIPLAGKSWETYLATLGAEHRYNFNRKWKRMNRDYSVRFEQVRTEEQCRESIDLLIALHNLRWRERGGSDAFHTPALVSFHRELSQVALKSGWLRLYVLRLNEEPAACLYGFLYHQVFYFYQSGLNPAYEKHSAGLVAMGLAIRSAIEEGAEEYDLLHGNEPYKSHWSRNSRELGRLELDPPGALSRLRRSSVELERASRKVARRLLTRSVPA